MRSSVTVVSPLWNHWKQNYVLGEKTEGITFGTTLMFHKENNNINLKTYYLWHYKQLNIYISHIQKQVQSSLNIDHSTGIITWYTYSIKLPNISSCSLYCDTDTVGHEIQSLKNIKIMYRTCDKRYTVTSFSAHKNGNLEQYSVSWSLNFELCNMHNFWVIRGTYMAQ